MNGTFVAQDLILFFVFFEVVLLPMYFMIGVWGGEQRQYASIKFFLFTLFGSALMLLSFLALFFKTGGQTCPHLRHRYLLSHSTALHRRTHAAADLRRHVPRLRASRCRCSRSTPGCPTPTPRRRRVGSVILAADPAEARHLRLHPHRHPDPARRGRRRGRRGSALLAVIGIIYGALGCLAQTDMKRLIAFSSVAHMGFVMLGIATLTTFGINAADLRHGRPRPHHRHAVLPRRLGEGALPHPRDHAARRPARCRRRSMGWILGFCAMASLGLPGLAGFWGEFPAILSAYSPAAGLSERAVPHLHGDRRDRHRARRRLPAVDVQRVAFGVPKAEFDRRATSTTSRRLRVDRVDAAARRSSSCSASSRTSSST